MIPVIISYSGDPSNKIGLFKADHHINFFFLRFFSPFFNRIVYAVFHFRKMNLVSGAFWCPVESYLMAKDIRKATGVNAATCVILTLDQPPLCVSP